jgi:tripartite-type tricarboxylate transporter receptor subunit TctC
MSSINRRRLLAGTAAAGGLLWTRQALAQAAAGGGTQAFPSRAVKIVVPSSAGGGTDVLARTIGDKLQERWGQAIVIDNKPGAQGSIAAAEAARAAPDGYTIFGGNNSTLAGNLSLYKKLPYNPAKDFTPVARFITASLMLVVRPEFPAKNLKEFIAYAKQNKSTLNAGYASAGMQVSMAELKGLGGVDFLEVPYKGVPQAVTDVMGGQIGFAFADFAAAFPQVRAGKLRGLGITAPTRTSLMPEMPAMAEELPGFDVTVWSGLVVPAGTPKDVVDKLWDASKKALAAPETASKLNALGLEVAPMGPDEFGRFITAETAKWARQIKAAGIQPE